VMPFIYPCGKNIQHYAKRVWFHNLHFSSMCIINKNPLVKMSLWTMGPESVERLPIPSASRLIFFSAVELAQAFL
jgi:hypothetical protein